MWLLTKVILFNLLIPGLLFVWAPWHLLRGDVVPGSWGVIHYAALPLLATGLVLYAQCIWCLAHIGHGTPLPFDGPRKLVQRGPYRWVRNPLYLAFNLIAVGQALFYFNLWLLFHALALASVLQLLVMLHEEEALRRRFGAMYSDYCHQVPRWWPRRPAPRETESSAVSTEH